MAAPPPIERIIELAADGDHGPMIQHKIGLDLIATQARHPDVDLPAFLDWDRLEREMPALWPRYWSGFTEDRRDMLAAIDDWTLSPALCDRLAAALVDPIDRVIRTPDGRVWLLLCRLHTTCGMALPSEQLVFGTACLQLKDANPPDCLPNCSGLILSRANRCSLEGILDPMVVTLLDMADEFERRALADRVAAVRAMTRGVLGSLLDERLPRQSWVVAGHDVDGAGS